MIQHILAPLVFIGCFLGGWAITCLLDGIDYVDSKVERVLLRIGAGFGILFLMLLAASIIVNYMILGGLVNFE